MSEAPPASRLTDVQVVVNSYGKEPPLIERAIASFLRQKRRPEKIHFIDQNEIPLRLDPTLQEGTCLVHHHRPVRVCSLARNLALELVPAGWIAFADDDSCWADDYSERLRELLDSQPSLQLIAGLVVSDVTGEPYSLRHRLGGRLDTFVGTKLLLGSNFLLRRETFARVGGYDPRLGPGTSWPSSEEADLCWRVVTSGVPARFAPQLRVLHPPMHDADARKAAQKAYSYGIGKGALAAIWIFERHHRYGFFEFAEMTVVPLINMLRGLLRGDFGQLRVQSAILRGRYRGFFGFVMRKRTP